MRYFLLIIAVVMGQSVLAADEVVIKDPIIRHALAKILKKPSGKFAPPLKFTKVELAKVDELNLYGTKITDASLKDVAKLTQLTELEMRGQNITDEGLKEAAKLQKLTDLYLDETQITDASFKEVAKLQQLELLELQFTKITQAGVAELQKALPKCDIDSDF